MGRALVLLADDSGQRWVLTWSTVVDAPVSWGVRREDVTDDPNRLARLDARGHTWLDDDYDSGEEAVAHNRAGHDECTLLPAEIIEWYCVRQQEPPPGVGHVCHPADLPYGIEHECQVCGSILTTWADPTAP